MDRNAEHAMSHLRVQRVGSPLGRRAFLQQSSAALVALGGPLRAGSAQRARTLAFFDPTTRRHVPAVGHPERPERLDAVLDAVRGLETEGRVALATPRPATEEEVLLVHTPEYLSVVRADVGAGRGTLTTGDTELSPGSLDAALAAAGTVLSAVDAVMSGRARNAFCAVRPPGHHASASRGMGFCIFNNIAIGARYAARRYGVDRLLIADWDVHHGNGTQAVFWRDGSVLFFDTHQHPWYPGTGSANEVGEGPARGLIVNRPFAAGAGRSEILGAFRDGLGPAAARFKPQLVMISAGFDSRGGDPLGRFRLSDDDFGELTTFVGDLAARYASDRVVSVLEGGYSFEGLRLAVRAHLDHLSA
jgi:acetoin utilization deacetylase AcuC-like enzyme